MAPLRTFPRFPFSAIERVEVMTDGASAVYGSDAVGGVVNFIMKKDYRGSETSVRYEDSSSGGTPEGRSSRPSDSPGTPATSQRPRAIARTIRYSRAMRDSIPTGTIARRAADSTPTRLGNPANILRFGLPSNAPPNTTYGILPAWRWHQLQSRRRHMGVQRGGRDPVRELQSSSKGA